MATLRPPFDALSNGQHALQAHVPILGWKAVGQCTVTVNDDYDFAANGNYNVFGHQGSFNVTLKLDDQNPNSTTGPATVTNDGTPTKSTYAKSGSSITFTDPNGSLVCSSDPGGVLLNFGSYTGRILK